MLDLKICSVSFNAYEYLKLNEKLMHPNSVEWVIVSNKPGENIPESMTKIDGVPPVPPVAPNAKIGAASYHHALALNKGCRSGLLDKRYVLLLDPDFFIIPSLHECVAHMQENNLAFFGSPYMIEPTKNRLQDFPVAFCMFIDTHQVDVSALDFTPFESPDRMADTGFNVYNNVIQENRLKWEATIPYFDGGSSKFPHTNKSIKERYGIATDMKMDQYFWKDKLFGLHCHMKLHLRTDKQTEERAAAHTKAVASIVKTVRKYDSAI